METFDNPFVPAGGKMPSVLAGRDSELSMIETLVGRYNFSGRVGKPFCFYGLRGTGKTVLLNEIKLKAKKHKWISLSIEASDVKTVKNETLFFEDILNREIEKNGNFNLESIGIKIPSFSIELKNKNQDIFNFEYFVRDLYEKKLKKKKIGLLLFIDEVQKFNADLLTRLIVAQHRLGQDEIPFVLICAGLPSTPAYLNSIKSYSERLFSFRKIGNLNLSDSEKVLSPLFKRKDLTNNTFDSFANLIYKASDGFPFFLQQYGYCLWELLGEVNINTEKTITENLVKKAIKNGNEMLDRGFYYSRWETATSKEKDFLTAMVNNGDNIQISDLQKWLKVEKDSQGSFNGTRNRLIEKGLIYSVQNGVISFALPNMKEYIKRMN
jgi:hypothetical protein